MEQKETPWFKKYTIEDVLEFVEYRKREIRKSLERIQKRREILDESEKELNASLARWETLAKELAKEGIFTGSEPSADLSDMRLADACYLVLKAKGEGMHAKDLVAELRDRGRTIQAKNPVDSVHKMLLRDRRFYRPGGHGTYWELEEWQVEKLEENKETTAP